MISNITIFLWTCRYLWLYGIKHIWLIALIKEISDPSREPSSMICGCKCDDNRDMQFWLQVNRYTKKNGRNKETNGWTCSKRETGEEENKKIDLFFWN